MSDSSFEATPRAQLLAIVSVQPEDRVLCAQPNCGHSVYAQIHVVQEGEKLLVLGSTCFGKRYGGAAALGAPRHGGTGGRPLTAAERQLLANNTAALLAQFERERAAALEASLAAEAARQADREAQHQAALEKHRMIESTVPVRRAPPAPALVMTPAIPWPWMKPYASLTYFEMRDGTSWMRVTHAGGGVLLVPWPMFEAWDESLPAHVGTPHPTIEALVIPDLVHAVAYLRQSTTWEKMCGLWRDMAAELAKRRSEKK
jgi:hypothetical protein